MPRPLPIAASLLLVVSACVSLDEPQEVRDEPVRLEHSELGGMAHVSVCGDIWLGSGGTKSDIGIASRRGVGTIVDLRAPAASLDVESLSSVFGFEYLRARVDSGSVSAKELDRLLVVLGRPDRSPVLLLDDDGSRSAIVFAIHRVYNDHRPVKDALQEARRAGLKPGTGERVVLDQLERLGLSVELPG